MVGDSFQLQRDRAQGERARRAGGGGQRLDQLTIRGRMAGGRIAGDRLGEVDAALVGPAAQRLFDAAVLVSERDFEMEDALAVTAEAKMPGLDDPGMHRANRDFMDFGPGNLEEINLSNGRAATREAHRLEPGVAFRADPPLLVDLALEVMRGRAIGGQCRITARDVGRDEADLTADIVGQRRQQPRARRHPATARPGAAAASPRRSRTAPRRGTNRCRRRGLPRSPPAPRCRS